jgi:anti-sigma regulatory factor (Ser/Thr protein kinase)
MTVMVIIGAITLERVAAAVPQGRRYVRALLAEGGADYEAAELIVSELLTNAVDHGAGVRMGLLVGEHDDRYRIEVSDGGGAGRTPCVQDVEPDRERGRGLLLVATIADEWGVEARAEGTTVWAESLRKPAG